MGNKRKCYNCYNREHLGKESGLYFCHNQAVLEYLFKILYLLFSEVFLVAVSEIARVSAYHYFALIIG